MQPIDHIQAWLVSLIGTITSLAVGLGAFGESKAQLIVTIGGTVLSALFSIINEFRAHTLAKSGQLKV